MALRRDIAVSVALPILLLAAGCTVAKQEENGRTTRLSISTPVGDLTARTGEGSGDTGLPVYPGAQPMRDQNDGLERANVAIGTRWFGLRVVAAEYESPDSAGRITGFYRDELRRYGTVTECRGNVDFNAGRPECRGKPDSDDIHLLAGTEKDHRMVSVTPHAGYTSFALISIQMGS